MLQPGLGGPDVRELPLGNVQMRIGDEVHEGIAQIEPFSRKNSSV
jgi:hypothetical protein